MKKSIIDLINILGVVVVAALVIFAVYFLFIGSPFYRASSYGDGTTESGEAGVIKSDRDVDSLEVKNISGRINAEAWSKNYIELEYQTTGPGRPPEVSVEYSGSTMFIKAVYPKSLMNFSTIHFQLRVPETLKTLKAGTVSGTVKVSGLENTAQNLSTTSGTIKTDGSTDINISSVSGGLKFVSSGDKISAKTTSGGISGELTEATDSGAINISSVSGGVVLKIPQGMDADVDLHSVSGSVSSDFPVSVTESRNKTLKGRLGSGGTSIDIGTVSGSIKLGK